MFKTEVAEPIKCNITALGGIIKTADKQVRVSNTALAEAFLNMCGKRAHETPLLPSNCVQYIYSNCTHIVVQVFDRSKTDLRYVVRGTDVCDDMIEDPEYYRRICPHFAPAAEDYSSTETGLFCSRCGSCAECGRNHTIFRTMDCDHPGDVILYEDIPLPRLLVTTVLGERGTSDKYYFIRKCHIHALPDSPSQLRPDTNVFNFPFGNLYEDGAICWGDNIFEPAHNLLFLDNVMTKYFTSTPFNGDLDPRGGYESLSSMISSQIVTTFRIYRYLSRQSTFPENLLHYFRTPTRYKDFIDIVADSYIADSRPEQY